MTKAALDYTRAGWSSIPVEPVGKQSLIGWQVHQHRRADPPEIGEWFARWPDANLAIVTGVVSGLVVLDVDPREGGEESLIALQREHGPIVETVEAATGAGGRHLYFTHPGEITRSRLGFAPGLSLLGDGSYAVAPPSAHPSGERYRWIRSPEVTPLALLPAWLSDVASDDPYPGKRSSAQWRRMLGTDVAEGERHRMIAALAGYIIDRGVDLEVGVELLMGWNRLRCRPPLGPEEVLRIAESVADVHSTGDDRP